MSSAKALKPKAATKAAAAAAATNGTAKKAASKSPATTTKAASKKGAKGEAKPTSSKAKSRTSTAPVAEPVAAAPTGPPPPSIPQLQAQVAELQAALQQEQTQSKQYSYSIQSLKQRSSALSQYSQQLQSTIINKLQQKSTLQQQCETTLHIYKHKYYHLQGEQTAALGDTQIDSYQHRLVVEREHRTDLLATSQSEVQPTELQFRQIEKEFHHVLHNIHQLQEQEIRNLRQHYEQLFNDLKLTADHQLKQLRESVEQQSKHVVERFDLQKHVELEALLLQHKTEFEGIQKYYSNITHSNLELIKNLKDDDLYTAKRNEQRSQKELQEIRRKYDSMSAPLKENQVLIQDLQHDLQVYEREKVEYAEVEKQLKALQASRDQLGWKHEILTQRRLALEAELADLRNQHTNAVYDTQQKLGFNSLLLEKKSEALSSEVEKTDVALGELLANCGLEVNGNSNIPKSLDAVLIAKNEEITQYSDNLEAAKRKYSRTIERYEQRLRDNHIHIDDLGFTVVKKL